MCMGGCFGCGLCSGVPIPEEVHEQYPPEVKAAWETFDAWWQQANEAAGGGSVSRSSMPDDVAAAMDLILETPIPGYDSSITGAHSCYMLRVGRQMVD